jgi:UDP-glucose 4-epimerase
VYRLGRHARVRQLMRAFISGSASHLARALLPRLCDDPDISSIIGLDSARAHFAHTKYRHVQADLRSADLAPLLHGCDALVHLAFVVLRGKTPAETMREINLDASQYGSGEQVNENAAYHPIPGFLYGEHKAALEHWLDRHHPNVVRLRPHIILGRHAQPLLKNLLRQPFYVRLPDPQPLLQCVHEEDVSAAIQLALKRPASGAYNLSAPDSFNFRDAIRARQRWALPLSPRLARSALALTWRLTGIGGEPGWMEGVDHSLTLDCDKAQRELGWQPQHSSAAMLWA